MSNTFVIFNQKLVGDCSSFYCLKIWDPGGVETYNKPDPGGVDLQKNRLQVEQTYKKPDPGGVDLQNPGSGSGGKKNPDPILEKHPDPQPCLKEKNAIFRVDISKSVETVSPRILCQPEFNALLREERKNNN